MKILLFILLATSSHTAFSSQTFRITGLTQREREGHFWLRTLSPSRLSLDCSSFLQNLTLEPPQGSTVIFYLTIDECVALYDFYRGVSNRKRCLTLDDNAPRPHICARPGSRP